MSVSSHRSDVRNGAHKELGWPDKSQLWYAAYAVSKLGVTLMTPILQRQLTPDTSRPDLVVNAVISLTDMLNIR